MSNHKYSENFKKDAVDKIKRLGDVNWVADSLGVQANTLRKWMRDLEQPSGTALNEEKRA